MGNAGHIGWRVLRGVLAFGLVLAVLAFAAWWGLPRLPPSEAQREAMALMREQPKLTGRNAWAAVWFLNKAVPEEQMQALAEADVADWQALLQRDVSAQTLTDWRPPSDARFLPEVALDDPRPCAIRPAWQTVPMRWASQAMRTRPSQRMPWGRSIAWLPCVRNRPDTRSG